MKISLASQAFLAGPYAAGPIQLDPIISRLRQAEYDGIELSGFEPHATLERYPNPEARIELSHKLEDNGLGVSGYAADFSQVNPVIEDNKQSYIDLFHRAVDLCVDLGSPVIRVDTAAAPGSVAGLDYEAAMDRLAGVWTDAAEIAARGKVRLVWEFDPGFLFNKPSEILELHRKVGHPNFQVLFHTAHAYMCAVAGARQHGAKETLPGGVLQLLHELRTCVGAVHLIDSDGTLYHNETSTRRPFDEGFIDFSVLAPKLLDVPEVEWWCIDLSLLPDSWDLIEPGRKFVLALLNDKVAA